MYGTGGHPGAEIIPMHCMGMVFIAGQPFDYGDAAPQIHETSCAVETLANHHPLRECP